MLLFESLLAHLADAYLIQSDWMATEKVKRWRPAIVHGTTYGLPFLLITQSPLALAVIVVTHIVLDRYRAAKYLVWARNLLAPASRRGAWADVQKNQGSPVTVPSGLANALVIIADNTVHLAINAAGRGYCQPMGTCCPIGYFSRIKVPSSPRTVINPSLVLRASSAQARRESRSVDSAARAPINADSLATTQASR
ncbi:DUF3307 domain-containing protein [Streptomyces sp. NPDC005046]